MVVLPQFQNIFFIRAKEVNGLATGPDIEKWLREAWDAS